jgi:hypothetical protein
MVIRGADLPPRQSVCLKAGVDAGRSLIAVGTDLTITLLTSGFESARGININQLLRRCTPVGTGKKR